VTRRWFAPREQKARKIRRMLSDFLGEREPHELQCLDVGCGDGEIARHLSSYFGKIVALDSLFEPVHEAHGQKPAAPVTFLQADGTHLPFAAATFDVVICAQVYEHALHAERLPAEVERVLKPGGLCFFSGPNKVWPIEPHYLLPFLHWLPDRLATLYMRASGKGEQFDIRPYTYWHLRRLWGRFTFHDCTVSLLREPGRFGLSTPVLRLFRWVPPAFVRMLYFLLPNYNWILVKPDEEKNPH
jgi:ubiquinone/menaquinone biosynthesis C-methylase UbiE